MTKERKRIFIIQTWNTELSHDICRGVYQYALQRPDWWCNSIGQHELLNALKWERTHGLIVSTPSEEQTAALKTYQKPCVLTGLSDTLDHISQVDADHAATGRNAADYLCKQGYEHFGVIMLQIPAQQQRGRGFQEELKKRGHTADPFVLPCLPNDESRGELTEWLLARPQPCALFCTADLLGRFVIALCRDSGLLVPDDIAVLGCENDSLVCEGIRPSLSSVRLSYVKMGFEAARLLDQRMKKPSSRPVRVLSQPSGVKVRQSTGHIALNDDAVRKAVHYIRRHAHEHLSVEQVAHHAGLSLRQMQRRFKPAVGHTAAREIQIVRVEQVKELLSSTDLSLASIARQTGYANEFYLGRNFKKIAGLSPSTYRRRYLLR